MKTLAVLGVLVVAIVFSAAIPPAARAGTSTGPASTVTAPAPDRPAAADYDPYAFEGSLRSKVPVIPDCSKGDVVCEELPVGSVCYTSPYPPHNACHCLSFAICGLP